MLFGQNNAIVFIFVYFCSWLMLILEFFDGSGHTSLVSYFDAKKHSHSSNYVYSEKLKLDLNFRFLTTNK